jgi:hypothetical protein
MEDVILFPEISALTKESPHEIVSMPRADVLRAPGRYRTLDGESSTLDAIRHVGRGSCSEQQRASQGNNRVGDVAAHHK